MAELRLRISLVSLPREEQLEWGKKMNKKSKDSKSGSTVNIDRREFIISASALERNVST
jgi:hypothetical protein